MIKTTYVAAGCFWGVQDYFSQIPGVVDTSVGYCGGFTDNPTYEDVCSHKTGHAETVKVDYDPKIIKFIDLCYQFFYMHDPTQLNRQGYDVGDNYRSAIFVQDDQEAEIVKDVMDKVASNFNQPIVTTIERFEKFYLAEDYHQDYSKKNHIGTCHIKYKELITN